MRWPQSASSASRALSRRLAPLAGLLLLAAGCAAVPTAVRPRPRVEAAAFLVDPLMGFPPSVSLEGPERLRSIHQALLAGRLAEVRAELEVLAQSAPLSSAVLQSELDLSERRFGPAAERLRPVVEQYPGYLAAQVVLGHAEEQLGEIVEAYAAYRAAPSIAVAEERVAALEPRVLSILGERVDSGLAQGRLADAEAALSRLTAWAPHTRGTLERMQTVAQAQQDPVRELVAVRSLTVLAPQDADLRRRQAELEVDWGDAGVGLRLYEELAAADPDDPELTAGVQQARRVFRMTLVPEEVEDLTRLPALTRGEFAALVYWLMPSVRTSRGVGRIASDALESPHRSEIVRVVNLGLIDMDAAQHLFSPDQAVQRHDALLCFLRLVANTRGGTACLGGARVDGPATPETVCSLAARCGLLTDAAECLPSASVSGPEAVAMARQVLDLEGGS